MDKKVYVMPDTHIVRREYVGDKAREMIEASEDFRKTKNPASVKLFAGSYLIDDKNNFTWTQFPSIVDFLSNNLHDGDYEGKAKILENSKPDVLFVESFTSKKELFKHLQHVDTDYIIGALGEGRNVYASLKPVYDFCKRSNVPVVPIDSKELMEKIWEVDKKAYSFKGDRKSEDFQNIEKEFKETVKKRSEFMLSEVGRNVDKLGADKTYIAFVGEQHYKDFMEIYQKDIEILHINKRLEALGTEVRYNESDY